MKSINSKEVLIRFRCCCCCSIYMCVVRLLCNVKWEWEAIVGGWEGEEEVFLGWTNDGVVGVLCVFFLFYFVCLHKCECY